MSDTRKAYSVWVDGKEVNDRWLTYKEASDLADKCVEDGYSPIIGNRDQEIYNETETNNYGCVDRTTRAQ